MLSREEKERILNILENGEMTIEGQFTWGSNYTLLSTVEFKDESIPAVYKPALGERPLWDFPPESLGKRETAAYLVSEAGGWRMVPPTVYRTDAPEGEGSVQYFIPHDPQVTYFSLEPEEKTALQTVVLYDLVINNTDRKGGHILRDKDLNYWLIDHGVTFHESPKLRTVVWDFAGQQIPENLIDQISGFKQKLGSDQRLRTELQKFISEAELIAMENRLEQVLEERIFPFPGEEVYPYPWPPV